MPTSAVLAEMGGGFVVAARCQIFIRPMLAALLAILQRVAAAPSKGGSTLQVSAVDPIKVGHERQVTYVVGGHPQLMKTLAMDPPVFLLPDFLSPEEADEVVDMAKASNAWQSSEVDDDGGRRQAVAESFSNKREAKELLRSVDRDEDGHLDVKEVAHLMQEVYAMPNIDEAAFADFLVHAKEDPSAKRISFKRFLKAKPAKYFGKLWAREPERRDRYSDQVWLEYREELPRRLRKRVKAITGLPERVINQSERMQIVRYPQGGHYACHHDSSPDSIDDGMIRIATLGMFLNDAKGGETAFPGADRDDNSHWDERDWAELESTCQPTPMCTRLGGLVVPAHKGDAILWYNVKPSALPGLASGAPRGDGFGERTLLWSSVHCGAEVLEGEKWFANLWLHLPPLGPHSRQEEL